LEAGEEGWGGIKNLIRGQLEEERGVDQEASGHKLHWGRKRRKIKRQMSVDRFKKN